MKLNTEAFPYPVLSPYNFENNDYVKTTFECEINTSIHTENKQNYIKSLYYFLIPVNNEIKNWINTNLSL